MKGHSRQQENNTFDFNRVLNREWEGVRGEGRGGRMTLRMWF